jgi:hypothetical protein
MITKHFAIGNNSLDKQILAFYDEVKLNIARGDSDMLSEIKPFELD